MKSITRIVVLFAVVALIIGFWLAPGVNTANDEVYARRYEDTSMKVNSADTAKKSNDFVWSEMPLLKQRIPSKKTFVQERIHKKNKLQDVKLETFSRSYQFEKVLPDDSLLVEEVEVDSAVSF